MGTRTRTPFPAQRLPETRAALDYAKSAHAGQLRTGGEPFIEHPREVAGLLQNIGAPDHLIAAGALHDVLEKTPVTAFDLRHRFGTEITSLVLAVTEDAGIRQFSKRKAALREGVAAAGVDALALLAADKISKARELRPRPPKLGLRARVARRRKVRDYRRCLALLSERLPHSPLVDQLADELDALP
jgi:(p)ppGpp synthase/HD superfamily hydrolase